MPCLVLKIGDRERRIPPDPDGQFRYTREPGEVMAGIDPDCGGDIRLEPTNNGAALLLAELDSELGKQGAGEWIKVLAKPVAKVMGRSNCMACDVRRVVADAYSRLKEKHGVIKAVTMIAELYKMAGHDQEAALQKLKEYLA